MSAGAQPWRLLVDPAADGAWNMAVDETLVDGYASGGRDAPTLRLYAWRPATLSLGRFQSAEGSRDPLWLREHAVDLVRRPTGGAAVLHEHERTYAVAGLLRHPPFAGSVLETYRRLAHALCGALARLGVHARAVDAGRRAGAAHAACFGAASAHEIVVDGRKLIGSAQLRRRGAFLQHGSILLRSDPQRLAHATGSPEPPRGYTDLERVLGAAPDLPRLDGHIVEAFEEAFGAHLVRDELDSDERARATRLRAEKYLTTAWTLEGRDLARGR